LTKRVHRYFFDFLDGQKNWLNEQAAQGWRLVKCGQLYYDFESCNPGEYEYTVEFVADRAHGDAREYRGFLESLGYTVFFKNITVGAAYGKVRWRPWAQGKGQFVTAPGGYFNELLIVEKRSDGKPFELHTDLSDKLPLYTRIRNALLMPIFMSVLTASMFLGFAFQFNVASVGMPGFLLGAVPFLALSLLLIKPLRSINSKIRAMEDEVLTNEYILPKKRSAFFNTVVALLFVAALAAPVIMITVSGVGFTITSGSAYMFTGGSGRTHWDGRYRWLNGYKQRSVYVADGTHTFAVNIVTDSGTIGFSLIGENDNVYYRGTDLPTGSFDVTVTGKDRVTLRVDANDHSGGYFVKWQIKE
jgi:hypothetical protein